MNPKVEALPKYKGYPIPFFVTYKIDSTPDFKITSEDNRKRCAEERLCWICGTELDYWIIFIGGPLSVKHRLFTDGPMHEDCAQDAMEICPFLLGATDYAPDHSFQIDKHKEDVKMIDYSALENREEPPQKVALYKTRSFKIGITNDHKSWFFMADKPKSITWRERVKK